MLYLKIEAYKALSALHCSVTARDLDAGPEDPGVLMAFRCATPSQDRLDELDEIVLVAQQALQRAVQSHMLGLSQHESEEG